MRVLLVLLGLLLPLLPAQTETDPVRAFYRGRELFDQKDFAGAVAAYEQALAAPETSPELMFNLGTACLFAGENGKALYYLRLAERLAPRDEDVARNLAVARSRAVDEIPVAETNPALAKLLVLHRRTTPAEAFLLFAILFVAGMALLHLRLLKRRAWFARIGLVLVVLGLSLALSAFVRRAPARDEGVILPAETGVFSGPDELTYQVFFKLHAGAEVQVLEERRGWVKIAVGDKKGYVEAAAIGVL